MKIASLLLCVLLLWGNAQAAVSVVLPEDTIILNENGMVITAFEQYEDAVVLANDLFAVKIDGSYALADAEGQLLTDAKYSSFRQADRKLIAKTGDHWGVFNCEGEMIVLFRYDAILPADDGYLALYSGENDFTELCSIDETGKSRRTGIFANAIGDEYACGLAAVRLNDTNLYGYCDKSGRIVIPAEFDYAGSFAGNCAVVVKDGKYGAIDAGGKLIVPAGYDFLQVSEAGFILAEKSGEGVYIYSASGAETSHYEDASSGCVLPDGKYIIYGKRLCVYDSSGNIMQVLPADASAYAGINGQLIISDGAWGEACVYLQNTQNRYQNIYPLGTVGEDAIYAYMTVKTGRYMNDMLGEIQYSFDSESARYGVIDTKGNILLEAKYRSVEYLCDNRLLVETENCWQMIDISGKVYWQSDAQTDSEKSA